MEKIPFFTFFQLLGGRNPPLFTVFFFISRAVLKSGDIQVSENVGLESPPGGGAGVFLALSVIEKDLK